MQKISTSLAGVSGFIALAFTSFAQLPQAQAATTGKPAARSSSQQQRVIRTPVTEVVRVPQEQQSAGESSTSSENWKGTPESNRFEVGALSGLGVIDSKAGYALLGTAAVKIDQDGFIPDINDTALIEFEGGPLFRSGGTPFQYSLHLRWDFKMDRLWTFYALAGVGGHIAGGSYGDDRFLIFPRVGLGAMLDVGQVFNLRFEVSHELIALGVTLPLF